MTGSRMAPIPEFYGSEDRMKKILVGLLAILGAASPAHAGDPNLAS